MAVGTQKTRRGDGLINSDMILRQSATDPVNIKTDIIVTDPPYYDAIPYADLSDFFFV